MLVVSNVSKQFPGAEAPILKDISFTVNAGERVALIGPNGCGKSTLIRLIIGQDAADNGGIQFSPPRLRIGYLSQRLDASDEQPIRTVLFPQLAALHQAERDVEHYASAIVTAGSPAALNSYADALEQLEQISEAIDFSRGERLLASLALAQFTLDSPVGALSGGQKTRLGLAAVLASDPQLLVLDEPTNHLDVTALEWLETWLQDFQGGALIVSHDRTFLDNTVNRVVAIDPETHTARLYEGGYSDYVYAARSELDKQWAVWRDQQVEIERLKEDARRTMEHSQKSEAAGGDRLAKKMAKKAHAKEKRLERYLASDELVEKPKLGWNLKLDFGLLPTGGQNVISTANLAIGYDPAHPLLTDLNLNLRGGERVAVVGPNGHGKSTLLKTLIGQLAPLGGHVRLGASIQVGYLAQEQEILDPHMNATETVMAALSAFNETRARSFLHFFLFTGDDALRPVGLLSFGERVRLMLAVLVAQGANLLVLDEPINHLDVPARERFEQALDAFQGSVLAVVHDRYFIDKFATTVWHVKDGRLTEEVKVSADRVRK